MSAPSLLRAAVVGLVVAAGLRAGLPAQGIGGGLQTVDAKIIVQEKLGQFVPGDIEFVDETGKTVHTGDWFSGSRPIVLNLGYFGCPRVCGAVLNGLMTGLTQVDMKPGEHYDVVTVSFDPRENAALAAAKKQAFLAQYPSLGLQPWHLHTGDQAQIDRLCQAVGFGYSWNEHSKDYDHSAVTVFLSPEGKVARYLYGYNYDKRDLRFAVLESAEGKVGSFAERLLVSCYAYDPQTREYRVLAIAVMQIGGVGTLVGLSLLLFAMWRRERRTKHVPAVRVDDLSAPREVTT
ncbi:MAG: SCO family protein [Planctomycetota bacterium]